MPKRPVLLAEFIPPDMQPRPVHSSTTCGCISPWQDPKAGADSKLLLEQQSKIALLMQQQEDMTHRLSVLVALEKTGSSHGGSISSGEWVDAGGWWSMGCCATPLSATEFGFCIGRLIRCSFIGHPHHTCLRTCWCLFNSSIIRCRRLLDNGFVESRRRPGIFVIGRCDVSPSCWPLDVC